MIAAVAAGQSATVEAILGPAQDYAIPRAARGMSFTVICNDGLQYMTQDTIDEAVAGVPGYITSHFLASLTARRDLCDTFPRREPDPALLAPVVSDTPTLLLTGAWDPSTPPRYAREAAQTLRHSTLIELPKTGHATVLTRCGLSLMTQFLVDPSGELDTACVAEHEVLDFEVPTP